MAKTVLFVGDVNVDLNLSGLKQDPVPDREIQAAGFEIAIGSSAAIAAVAYASLGGRTAFLGLAGEDEYGRFMVREMAKTGIDVGGIKLDPEFSTGVTVNMVRDQHRTQVTYPGAIPYFKADPDDFTKIDDLRHVHFAGIYQQRDLLPLLPKLMGHLRSQGISVSVDPQWDETEQWKYSESWLTESDIVLLNADEARSITGAVTLPQALDVLAVRCPCVIVKDGAAGAALREGGREYRVKGHAVDLVDTIGAGDNFAAGFLYARIQKEMDVGAALRYANAVAARSCRFPGGTGARSSDLDIITFLEERQ